MPAATPAKSGSAKMASVKSSQQSVPMTAMLARMPMKIMVMVSREKCLTVAPSTTTAARSEHSRNRAKKGVEIRGYLRTRAQEMGSKAGRERERQDGEITEGGVDYKNKQKI